MTSIFPLYDNDPMVKKSIPQILEEIGALLEIKGENPFKTRAYLNAAKTLSTVEHLDELIAAKKLKEIRGVGEAIARKVEEYAETGRMVYLEELTREVPESLLELLQIPNLGPKKIKTLYDELAVTNVGELEYACKENRLVNLSGFGAKTQEKILRGIEFIKKHKGQFLFGDVYPEALAIRRRFEEAVPAGRVELCGSLRRRKEVVRDMDILVAGDSRRLTSLFVAMPGVAEVLLTGETKTSCRLASGIEADLRVVSEEEFPYALAYFTGSKEHNVRLRSLARGNGWKLNEYGLFHDEQRIRCDSEDAIYRALGLAFVPPELREDMGEVEVAAEGSLPELIELADVRGTFHVHTDFSDGIDSLERMVEGARKMGLQYLGVSDHSKSAFYAGGLKTDALMRQWELIDTLNEKYRPFRIFRGIESDILPDGSLDYDEEILRRFDFVIASVHSSFGLSRADQERRITRAMENPYTTMLGHPTGRLLLSRDGYAVEMKTLIDRAAATGVILELNASPYRLDIDWRHLKYAKAGGVLIAINPDAHAVAGLQEIDYGVGIARKGWQEKKDVVNTRTAEEVAALFQNIRRGKGA